MLYFFIFIGLAMIDVKESMPKLIDLDKFNSVLVKDIEGRYHVSAFKFNSASGGSSGFFEIDNVVSWCSLPCPQILANKEEHQMWKDYSDKLDFITK